MKVCVRWVSSLFLLR
jgi:hypothetical protein